MILESAESAGSVIGATGYSNIYADNYLDIKRKIAAEAGVSGSYEGFSGSIDAKYNYTDQVVTKLHFMKISFLISGNRLSIREGRAGLKKNFTPTFADALKAASPDELFEDYGTHIATAVMTVAKAEYFCRSSETSQLSSSEFEAAATGKYQQLGGSVEGRASTTVSAASEQKDVVGNESISTPGGDASLAAKLSSTGGWSEWAATCQDLPAFLSFDVLVPVWDLTDDAKRKSQIRDAYRRRAAKTLRTHIMSVTSDSASHPEARITVPDGYKLLTGGALDDWSGAGNLLTASFPESDNTWRAGGKDHTHASPAKITAYAIVTYDPDDIWSITQRSITSGQAAHPSQDVSTQDGYTMIGGGAQVNWSGSGNLLTASYPRDRITWACAAKDHLESKDPDNRGRIVVWIGGANISHYLQFTVNSDPAADLPRKQASAVNINTKQTDPNKGTYIFDWPRSAPGTR
jgi:hypothetical protein